MKKRAYKSAKGSSFRTCFHGNRFMDGRSFRRVAKAAYRRPPKEAAS